MAMTPLPTAPSRAVPATFATLADTFVTALPQFVTDANTLQTDVVTRQSDVVARQTDVIARQTDVATKQGVASTAATNAATSATAAATSANTAINSAATSATSTTSNTVNLGSVTFAIQTGKLFSVGQTVVIASTATPTTQMVGIITASDNVGGSLTVNVTTLNGSGAYTAWTISMSGPQGSAASVNGGATRVSSATSITLTAGSTRLQAVTLTATGLSVTLPDATTLPLGGVLYVVKNEGVNPFSVRDGSGSLLCVLSTGQIGAFYLLTNGTAAGSWAVGNQSFINSNLSDTFVSTFTSLSPVNSSSSSGMVLGQLSATSYLLFQSYTTGSVAVITISGTTITIGSQVILSGPNTIFDLKVSVLSPTKALLTYVQTSGTVTQATIVTIAGSVVTIGSSISFGSGAGADVKSAPLTSTTALVTYIGGGGTTAYAVVVTATGTVPVAGTAVPLYTANALLPNFAPNPAVISSTAVLVATNISGYIATQVLSISGTTITNTSSAGLLYMISAGYPNINENYGLPISVISSTSAVLYFYSGAAPLGIVSCPITLSGLSVPTYGTLTLVSTLNPNSAAQASGMSIAQISPTKIDILITSNVNPPVVYLIPTYPLGGAWVAGLTTTLSTTSIMGASAAGCAAITQVSTGKCLSVYAGTSMTSPVAAIIESTL